MSRAAEQLRVSPAAVSATIKRVEQELGVRIFERTTRSLRLTAEGHVVVDGCEEVLRAWQRTLNDARSTRNELQGEVHVAAPADTALQILEEVAVRLSDAHPRLRIVLEASDRVQNVHRDAIDLAIRYGPMPDSQLTARRLAVAPVVLVASPAYVERHGVPASPADLAHHRCLTLHRSNLPQVIWRLERGGDPQDVVIDSPLCGDGLLARRWAVQGAGIALKSLFDVIDDLEQGRLVRVLEEWTAGDGVIHAVFPGRRYQPARVRAVAEAVGERCRERAARCEAWLGACSA